MGPLITGIRNKFIILPLHSAVELTNVEVGFLLFALQDTFVTSHSSIVKSQLGISMQFLRPDTRQRTVSEISDMGSSTSDAVSGTYQTEWDIIQHCMRKLGLTPPPPYKKLRVGPDGDPDAISTPMHRPTDDGTGYNHT